jgi:hypothetical protein
MTHDGFLMILIALFAIVGVSWAIQRFRKKP